MSKPIIGIDMDGVICRPPLGFNLRIGRGPYHNPLDEDGLAGVAPPSPRLRRSPIRVVLETLKYLGRSPMPDAHAALLAIKEHRDLVLITSRSGLVQGLVESWLARNRMLELFDAVHTNHTGLRSPEFKWHMVSQQGIREFIDDDGRVADLLARKGLKRIYLRDWPRNRGYRYPENVVRVGSLAEVPGYLAGAES
ncbi:MAG: hypothetical protein V3U26_03310 [Dehalococcoidia bacterium]